MCACTHVHSMVLDAGKTEFQPLVALGYYKVPGTYTILSGANSLALELNCDVCYFRNPLSHKSQWYPTPSPQQLTLFLKHSSSFTLS
ncbi:hypothetical protein XELAEV_18022537mg [Xenopus laevis]|uniref:Uncharacterized protein n=1 Tax=Xenopus laevis TaxID=8355 RepID=A0A974D2I4_XENLA|nr:hypothetical protein XELAEV_18022537mg [Xenopus laevis]